MRRNFQVVFQDPYSSLSPRLTVEQIIGEGLNIHFPELDKQQRRERILAIMAEVGLEESMLWRYPHEFSGGQRQRIAIARVAVLEPKLILLDEPTSALDVSVQKQVLELLRRLQQKHGMSYLFITHDLRVIRAMAHRMIVMQNGRIVEAGETEALFAAAASRTIPGCCYARPCWRRAATLSFCGYDRQRVAGLQVVLRGEIVPALQVVDCHIEAAGDAEHRIATFHDIVGVLFGTAALASTACLALTGFA